MIEAKMRTNKRKYELDFWDSKRGYVKTSVIPKQMFDDLAKGKEVLADDSVPIQFNSFKELSATLAYYKTFEPEEELQEGDKL